MWQFLGLVNPGNNYDSKCSLWPCLVGAHQNGLTEQMFTAYCPHPLSKKMIKEQFVLKSELGYK